MHPGRTAIAGAAIVAALVVTSGAFAQSAPTRVVALTGTDGPLGPGLGPGVTFTYLGGASRDNAGRIAFKAAFADAAVPNAYTYAIMLDDENGRRVIDSTDGGLNEQVDLRGFDDNGILISRTPWSDPKNPFPEPSIWRWTNDGAMTLICEQGVTPPGAPAGHVLDNAAVAVNLAGEIIVSGELHNSAIFPSSRGSGVWRWTPGGLEPLIVMGQSLSVAGLSGTVNEAYRNYFNDDGRLFLNIELETPVGPKNILLQRTEASYEAIIVEGQPVSDGSGAHYRSAGVAANSDGDQLLIGGILGGLNAGTTYSVSRYADGQPTLIAKSRDPVPGLGGPWFINFGATTNRNNEVAMTTSISHQQGDAGWHRMLWRVLPDNSMALLLRDGDTLPLSPAGSSIIQFDAYSTRITEGSDIQMQVKVGNGSGTALWGNWLLDPTGRVGLLVRDYQALPISPSETRFAIDAWAYLQGDAGVGSARFEDGADAIIEVQRTIPCPGDANADDAADMADLSLVIDAFNKSYNEPGYSYPADLNRDGEVDFTDLNLVLAHFNQSCR